jgi:uncharacterized protein DUF4352
MIPTPAQSAAARGPRRVMRRRWLLAWLCLGVAACQRNPDPDAPLPAPSTPPERVEAQLPPLADRAARTGEVATAAHYSMSVSETKECAMESHFRPSEGFIKLGVKVSIEARDATQVPANPFYATLIDTTSVVYESTLAGCQPALAASQLVKGQKASGWISFDVPADAKGLRLAYAPVLLGAGREELLFQLGR